MKKKTKIFLCDMVHNYLGVGSYMFPLNIGFIATYTNKYFAKDVEVKLFKYPDTLLKELKVNLPDIIGFSNYTWNSDLNNRLSHFIKSLSKKIMVVFGGPNINYTKAGIEDFFATHKATDFYVPFQGETPFVKLLEQAFDSGMNTGQLKEKTIEGIYFYNEEQRKLFVGKIPERIKNPDSISSPYLTGLLDEFFHYNLIPIIETNRGCPYQCTFCAQGLSSHREINFFSLERVKEELDYIAKHVKNTNLLSLADSNFGIVKRDIEIARYIANLYERTGYPRKCNTNWAKNQPQIFEIAKILNNVNLIVSLQSLDDVVLKNVKRSNIEVSVFKDIVAKINALDGISGTEIILGLPGETKKSHMETLRKLFDWDVSYIICYNGLVLKGAELSLAKEAGQFKCKTKYRLIDSSFGEYGGIRSFESEEGILSTETMTEEELLFFRPVHWLIQFMWNYRFYYDFLKCIQYSGLNPLDFIVSLIDTNHSDVPEKVRIIFDEFRREAKNEWFNSAEELQNHYQKSENLDFLKNGLYGKLNGKYIFRILLEAKNEFENYLCDVAKNYSEELHEKKEILNQLMKFLSVSIIDFNNTWEEIKKERSLITKYNFLEYKKLKYQNIEELYNPLGFNFRFYLPEMQEESLKKLLQQYSHKNKNVTLRKMSEFMPIWDFFYKVELT